MPLEEQLQNDNQRDADASVRRFKTEQEKREHVIKLNLARRHLEPYEWGQAFKMLLDERGIKRGKPGPKLPKSTDTETVSASEKIGSVAAELGVDERTARNRLKAADTYDTFTAAERLVYARCKYLQNA